MIWLHLILGIVLVMFANAFVKGALNDDVSEDSMIGLGVGLGVFTFLSLLAFGLSFLK